MLRARPFVAALAAAAAAAVLAVAAPARAGSYVVAPPPAGSDGNDGSAAHPWATLQHAADTVGPGDTVDVKPGSYAGFQLETSGTAGAEIAFVAESGASITSDNAKTPDGINLEGASYARIEGFTVNGRTRAGIRAVTASHVTIRNNHADGNGHWGVFLGFVDDAVIEGNACSNSQIEHGIYFSNSGDRPVIRGNLVWGNHANGIHMNGDISQGGDGIISNARVEANVVWDNGTAGGSGINCDGVQDSTIQNNLLFGNHASGISLYMIDGAAGSTNDVVVANTIVMAADARWALNVQNASTGGRFEDDILVNLSSHGAIDISADSLAGVVSDYNAVTPRFTADDGNTVLDLAGWRAMGHDAHSFAATPTDLFVTPGGSAAAAYELKPGSPAIDTGTSDHAPASDLAGTARPQGAGFDIGALEACTGTCASPPGVDAGVGGGDGGGNPGGGDGGTGGGTPHGGCCDARTSGGAPALTLVVALALVRRRARGRRR